MKPEEFLSNLDPYCDWEICNTGIDSADAFFQARTGNESLAQKAVLITTKQQKQLLLIDQISHADVFIDLEKGIVTKRYFTMMDLGVKMREAHWLSVLSGSSRTPTLLDQGDDWITITYHGEPLRHHNLPTDWQSQCSEILGALDAAGCRHNDIKCDNIVVDKGKMTLIDFGWATQRGREIPPHWPEQVGRQHRLGVHQFDDRYAIRQACLSAKENRVDLSRRIQLTQS